MITHDPKAETQKRIARTEAYAEKVRTLFAQTVNQILALNKRVPTLDDGAMYSFDGENMRIQKQVEFLLRQLHSVATMAIKKGITLEWEQANQECDKLVSSLFGKKVLESAEFSAWNNHNSKARDAFINRSEKGLNLSDRVWQSVRQLRDEMEVAMTVAIGEGDSAQSMSKAVRKYLNDPDLMFRRFRYKDENGEWQRKWKKRIKTDDGKYKWIDYDRDDYKTGAGVYKSSAKNAMRVARTETNIAYRRADNERWSQMDFVLGQKIQLSKSHPQKDICDKLEGDYPKDFVFDGWHPQCFCFVTPILADWEEQKKMEEAMIKGEKYVSPRMIKNYPQGFRDWVTEHADNIAAARDRGTEPYFIRNNAAVIDDILNPDAKQPLTTLEKAKLRHEARTPEQIAEIKARAEERQKKHALIRKTANNILKVAGDYGEVDYSTLQKYIDEGNLDKMQIETKAVAQQVLAMKKQEQALSALIPDAHALHKSYSLNELKEAYNELDGVFGKWLSKYSYSSLDAAPLAHLRNKVDFEISNPTVSYTNKKLVDTIFNKHLNIIENKIAWEELSARAASFSSFKTKSSAYKACLDKVNEALASKDTDKLKQAISEIEKKQQEILSKRSGGAALNKEYTGTAKGKDLTAKFDATKIAATDSYSSEKRYTNDIARLQGFDAPAKLVSAEEFALLESAHGDVFSRTVNAVTIGGKNYTAKEFARLYITAKKLDMNGGGGRVYGDGIYVASSSWDGRKLNKLSDSNKQSAFYESACYGDRHCVTMEMTWNEKPNLIELEKLEKMWRALTPKERAKFGNHVNTYGCALGYDGGYASGPNYIVVWNRSKIAILNKGLY